MRTAAVCPTCATYTNALCIVYDGEYLPTLDVSPLDNLESILGKIDEKVGPKTGTTSPTINAEFIGQLYVDTLRDLLYYAKSVGTGATDWRLVLSVSPIVGALVYPDNATALAAGLVVGQVYRSGDILKIVH